MTTQTGKIHSSNDVQMCSKKSSLVLLPVLLCSGEVYQFGKSILNDQNESNEILIKWGFLHRNCKFDILYSLAVLSPAGHLAAQRRRAVAPEAVVEERALRGGAGSVLGQDVAEARGRRVLQAGPGQRASTQERFRESSAR